MSRVSYNQAGYNGNSMSLRAKAAYEEGEKPMSKWTKTQLLYEIDDLFFTEKDRDVVMSTLSKVTLKNLRKNCLRWSSWHHTGKFANETDFYEIADKKMIREFVDDVITGFYDAKGNYKLA